STAQTAWELADQYALMAIERNSELAGHYADVELAQSGVDESFGAMMPTVDFSSRLTRAGGGREIEFDVNDFLPSSALPVDVPPTIIPFMREQEQETKIGFVQPLFVGGGYYHGWMAAKFREKAVKAGYGVRAGNLAFQVYGSYFDYLTMVEILKVREKELERTQEQLRVTNALFMEKSAPEGELKRIQAEVAYSKAEVIEAGIRVNLARSAFNRLLENPFEDMPGIPIQKEEIKIPEMTLQQAIESANKNRLELDQLGEHVEATNEMRKAVRAKYLPSLVAAGEYGFQGEDYSFDEKADYYMISGIVSWSLFEGFRSNARSQQIEIELRRLKNRQSWVSRSIELDVTNAWLSMEGKIAKHDAAEEALEAAKEGHRITKQLYTEGMATMVEILDAEAILTGASVMEITSRYQYLKALADIERSTGEFASYSSQ
ncbi:MAG: TolC family protein, partial [Candidatus Electryonea clarkiae]|nr:TolC family protein [Candidatus Electryonea clarkiae]